VNALEDARRAYRELEAHIAALPGEEAALWMRPLECLALDFGLLAELARSKKYDEQAAKEAK
jgi:hypothetical protein